jgi:hypothetical protein
LNIEPGSRHPLHCTAGGKLFLAQMNLLERKELLDRLVLTRMTPHTLTDRRALEKELDRLKEKMIGEDKEELFAGWSVLLFQYLTKKRKWQQLWFVILPRHAWTGRTDGIPSKDAVSSSSIIRTAHRPRRNLGLPLCLSRLTRNQRRLR